MNQTLRQGRDASISRGFAVRLGQESASLSLRWNPRPANLQTIACSYGFVVTVEYGEDLLDSLSNRAVAYELYS